MTNLKSPRSWEMVVLLSTGFIVLYFMRFSTSLLVQKMRGDLAWTEYEKGVFLSTFYFGYGCGKIPACFMAQKYGAKLMFGLSVLLPSLISIMIPMSSANFPLLVFLRILSGVFESACYPSCYVFYGKWIPNSEKTLMIAILMSSPVLVRIIS